MKDRYHNPPHYCNSRLQPWDVVQAWGLNFFEGNVVKYLCRCASGNTAKKHATPAGTVEDLKKAREYLNELIRQAEKKVEDEKQKPTKGDGKCRQCGAAPVRQ